jgi:hypothetical protein
MTSSSIFLAGFTVITKDLRIAGLWAGVLTLQYEASVVITRPPRSITATSTAEIVVVRIRNR